MKQMARPMWRSFRWPCFYGMEATTIGSRYHCSHPSHHSGSLASGIAYIAHSQSNKTQQAPGFAPIGWTFRWQHSRSVIHSSSITTCTSRQVRTFTSRPSSSHDKSHPDDTDLQLALSPQDEQMYQQLLEYKNRWGDCHVPTENRQRTEELRRTMGVSDDLTSWVSLQRQRYIDLKKGRIKDPVEKHKLVFLSTLLESIGFIWTEREANWQRSFNRLLQYKERFNSVHVQQTKDAKLWSWAAAQRKAYQKGKLSENRFKLLNDIGFVFDLQEAAWWNFYEKLCDYAKTHGTPDVPTQSKDDPSLGTWVARQRRQYLAGEISPQRVDALESIGFLWDVHEQRWDQFYNELVAFHATHGHTRVPVAMGALWHWVERQRRHLRKHTHEDHQEPSSEDDHNNTEKIAALNQINFDWSQVAPDEQRAKRLKELTFSVALQEERWQENFQKLSTFQERYGHFVVPHTSPKYQELASWVKNQRFAHKRGRLSSERVAALNNIGFAWTGEEARWDRLYQQLVKFHTEHGHTRIPTKQRELYRWITQQRRELRSKDNQQQQQQRRSNGPSEPNPKILALEKILSDEK